MLSLILYIGTVYIIPRVFRQAKSKLAAGTFS